MEAPDFGTVEEFGGRGRQPDQACVQDGAVVGDGQARAGVLLDQQDGPPVAAEVGEDAEHRLARPRFQPRRRLVEAQDRRIEHHGPGDLHRLLLTAG